jgi:hypothetical protein
MKTHNFDDFACTSAGRRAASLLLAHEVKPHQIFAIVLAEVTQILPELDEGGRFKTEDLCDPEIWGPWRTAEKRVAGMALSYMVKTRMVVLFRHLTRSGKGSAKYRTAPSPEPMGRPIRVARLRRTGSGRNPQLGS